VRKEKKHSLIKKLQQKIILLFRLNRKPVVIVYNGYGNDQKVVIFGHLLQLSPAMRKRYRQNWLINALYLLRLFMVSPYAFARLSVEWGGSQYYTRSQDDGFFRFELDAGRPPRPGWHKVVVQLEEERFRKQKICGAGQVLIPFASRYVFVSDIDDTFLISHSSSLRRRLYVLLTKNAWTRRPFEGVVKHYRLLASYGQRQGQPNPFFYVSSSEWNLFYFIREFTNKNGLPKGIFLLNELKKLAQVFRTGQHNHATKFRRIVRIVEAFPQRRFVLFGDDSQDDPTIYAALAGHFAGRIYAVYIRRVHQKKFEKVQRVMNTMAAAGVHCCYFTHSEEAITHSKKIQLVADDQRL